MTATLQLAWAARSDTGRKRQRNEDAFSGAVHQQDDGADAIGLFMVCDGMGGHAGGREASQLAVRVLRSEIEPLIQNRKEIRTDLTANLEHAVRQANQAIFDGNEGRGAEGTKRSGTTLVLLFVIGRKAWVVHVGDSRAYLVTRSGTQLLTADHNIGNREIRRGADPDHAWQRADADMLTQALGPYPSEHIHPDIRCFEIAEDSLFLLCSDGMSDNDFIEANEKRLLRPLLDGGVDLSSGCDCLTQSADLANGHDNITAILVRALTGTQAIGTTVQLGEATTQVGRVRRGWLERVGGIFSRRRR